MNLKGELKKHILANSSAMLAVSVYVLADTFFIAMVQGAKGIAALGIILPIYGVLYGFGAMLGMGSATAYSLAGKVQDEKGYFGNAVFWGVSLSLVLVILALTFGDGIMTAMGADPEILAVGRPYFRTVMAFTPAFILSSILLPFVRNDGAPRVAMMASVTSSIFNIIFDYLFMFPMNMGMKGAALATGLSPVLSSLICLAYFIFGKHKMNLRLVTPSFKKLVYSCRFGVVAFVSEIMGSVTILVFNFLLLGLVGNIAVSAYGIISNLAIMINCMLNGVVMGFQPLSSQSRSRNDRVSEKFIRSYSMKASLGISLIFLILVWLFSHEIVALFNQEGSKDLIKYTVPGLRFYFLGFLIAAINSVNAGFASAVGESRLAAFISIFRGIIAIVFFALLLSRLLGINGVWLSFLAAEITTYLITRTLGRSKSVSG